jgi:GH43 family beta-xylosidase
MTNVASDRADSGAHRSVRIAVLVAAVVSSVVVAVATTVTALAAHPAPLRVGGVPSSLQLAADRPPVNPDPAAPAVDVPSGENESDPFLYVTQGRYFLYTSGLPGPHPVNVPVASATNFTSWGPVTDALPSLPAWAVPGFTWAPDVHRFGSSYVLYFTAMRADTRPAMECIGAAVGANPDGPFTAAPTPFICQPSLGGSIDPRVFADPDGTQWMAWKSDQNIDGSSTPTQMWSRQLTDDGLGLVGQAVDIMQPDERWQGTIVEAPDLVDVDGVYWVFYSGNWFNEPAYAIGAARCAGPAGPCADSSPLPLLASDAQGQGPGEASVFQDSNGVWLLYSPFRSLAPRTDPPRPVAITRLGFGPEGPYLAAGGPPPSLAVLGSPALFWSVPQAP